MSDLFGRIDYRLGSLSLITALVASGATVTVRSGSGPIGGRDSAVTFLLGPAVGDFSNRFTSADFSSAQNGPAAFIVPQNPAWISGLPSDPSARWIGTNANAANSGSTALYAASFSIPSPFTSATLTLHFAVDDGIGATNAGIFLNGIANCNPFGQGFGAEQMVSCNDVGPLLRAGANWLYVASTGCLATRKLNDPSSSAWCDFVRPRRPRESH